MSTSQQPLTSAQIPPNTRLTKVPGEKVLRLTLHRKAFEIMITGEKTTEYRQQSKWIMSRLYGKHYDLVEFSNGYSKVSPKFTAIYRGWSVEPTGYSVDYSNGLKVDCKAGTVKIYLGPVLQIENW
jgi:hypothetical protein